MRKTIITLAITVFSAINFYGQELNPNLNKRANKIVKERTTVMDLSKKQSEEFLVIQKELFLKMQVLATKHERGTEEFKVEMKKYNKEFAQDMMNLTSKEQRVKWRAHMESKK